MVKQEGLFTSAKCVIPNACIDSTNSSFSGTSPPTLSLSTTNEKSSGPVPLGFKGLLGRGGYDGFFLLPRLPTSCFVAAYATSISVHSAPHRRTITSLWYRRSILHCLSRVARKTFLSSAQWFFASSNCCL